MPLQRCGDNGWKWGDSGKCYTGPEGKKKAIKQGLAVEGPEKFAQKANLDKETLDIVGECLKELGKSFSEMVLWALHLEIAKSKRRKYIYQDPKTGEQFTYVRQGNFMKNGRRLLFIREER